MPSALAWQEVPPVVALKAGARCEVIATAPARACESGAPPGAAALQVDAAAVRVEVGRSDSVPANRAAVEPGAAAGVDCWAAAAARFADASLQPVGLAMGAGIGAAAAAQKAGSAAAAHSVAVQLQPDGSVLADVHSAVASLEADG